MGDGKFKKGDARCNRSGRPKTFQALRDLALLIGAEPVGDGKDRMTRIEALLRAWSTSKDGRLQALFVAYAYGEPPKTIQGNTEGGPIKIVMNWGDEDKKDG